LVNDAFYDDLTKKIKLSWKSRKSKILTQKPVVAVCLCVTGARSSIKVSFWANQGNEGGSFTWEPHFAHW